MDKELAKLEKWGVDLINNYETGKLAQNITTQFQAGDKVTEFQK